MGTKTLADKIFTICCRVRAHNNYTLCTKFNQIIFKIVFNLCLSQTVYLKVDLRAIFFMCYITHQLKRKTPSPLLVGVGIVKEILPPKLCYKYDFVVKILFTLQFFSVSINTILHNRFKNKTKIKLQLIFNKMYVSVYSMLFIN